MTGPMRYEAIVAGPLPLVCTEEECYAPATHKRMEADGTWEGKAVCAAHHPDPRMRPDDPPWYRPPTAAGVCTGAPWRDRHPGQHDLGGPAMTSPMRYESRDAAMAAMDTGTPDLWPVGTTFTDDAGARHRYDGASWVVVTVPVEVGLLERLVSDSYRRSLDDQAQTLPSERHVLRGLIAETDR